MFFAPSFIVVKHGNDLFYYSFSIGIEKGIVCLYYEILCSLQNKQGTPEDVIGHKDKDNKDAFYVGKSKYRVICIT